MIGVSLKPSSSSAARIAPTRPSIMSLGATMSAPARACETAVCAISSTLVVVDGAVGAQQPAVAVVGVLAEADVGDHEQIGMRVLDRARGDLDDRLRRRRRRCRRRPCARGSRTAARPAIRAPPPRRPRAPLPIDSRSMPGIAGIGVRPALPAAARRTSAGRGRPGSAESRGRGRAGPPSRAAAACGSRGRTCHKGTCALRRSLPRGRVGRSSRTAWDDLCRREGLAHVPACGSCGPTSSFRTAPEPGMSRRLRS